jgi:hypothetical protein
MSMNLKNKSYVLVFKQCKQPLSFQCCKQFFLSTQLYLHGKLRAVKYFCIIHLHVVLRGYWQLYTTIAKNICHLLNIYVSLWITLLVFNLLSTIFITLLQLLLYIDKGFLTFTVNILSSIILFTWYLACFCFPIFYLHIQNIHDILKLINGAMLCFNAVKIRNNMNLLKNISSMI